MAVEWVRGTIDPENGLERGPVLGSWQRTIPTEEQGFNEEAHRPLLERIVKEQGSQALASFVNEVYKLKNKIKLG